MYSEDVEKVIADLNEFLIFRHPSSVLQFITGMMIGWTHSDKMRLPSKSKIDLAWSNYFSLLKSRIDKRLSSVSPKSHNNARQKALRIPQHGYEKEKLSEVISLLRSMSPGDAIEFMVEVTINWCFSIPLNYLPLLPDAPRNESDEAIADAIYKWLVGYYDLWP